MRIFVTGATGFIGTALIPELIKSGHQVLGLTRSKAGAESLRKAGAESTFGSIEDLDSLRDGASRSDGVIHLAFNHDFSRFQQNCEDDRKLIEAIGEVLEGSSRPFVVTSGTTLAANEEGKASTEASPAVRWNPRSASEAAVMELTTRGVNASIVRLSQVHNTRKQGLVQFLLAAARQKQLAGYIGDGSNRWPAVHVSDAARLYLLAFAKGEKGGIYHAVAEEGVSIKAITEALGHGLNVPVASIRPEEAEAHFGWMAQLAGLDMPASSAVTQQKLGWKPTGPGMLADLEGMDYTKA